MKTEFTMTSNSGSSLRGDEFLLGDSRLIAATSESDGNNTVEV
jgi:hypothetical protein